MLTVNDISFSYVDDPLFSKCSFRIGNGRHVALVGDNGTGKTTLLRLIAGILKPDEGMVRYDGHVEMVSQFPADMEEVSPGQGQMQRISRAFAKRPDILLLDEPTSNLDVEGIRKLTGMIGGFRGIAVIISHDIAFLEKAVDGVLMIENRHIDLYDGDFEEFRQIRERNRNSQYQLYEVEQKQRKRQKKVAQKMREKAAKSRKSGGVSNSDARARSLLGNYDKVQKRLSANARRMQKSLDEGPKNAKPYEKMGLKLLTTYQKPQKVRINLDFDGLFGHGIRLIDNSFSFRIRSGETVGLLGRNGSGKSTLMDEVEERLEKRSCRVSHFRQQIQNVWEEGGSLLSQLMKASGMPEQVVLDVAGAMGLHAGLLSRTPDELSGGQLLKAQLVLELVSPFDVLLLDEPTNYLDYDGVKALTEFIRNSEAAVVVISHDERFVEGCVDRTYLISDGRFSDYCDVGDYFGGK
ncbi:ATP-binding cassette domain-containing protein [Ligilactobacillus sp.]|uniref:ATP-binding cassette domain-containing protein n=1 Tax=Ligilactobacillus sp. TaxID=2767921 RepID=UPI002FE1E871